MPRFGNCTKQAHRRKFQVRHEKQIDHLHYNEYDQGSTYKTTQYKSYHQSILKKNIYNTEVTVTLYSTQEFKPNEIYLIISALKKVFLFSVLERTIDQNSSENVCVKFHISQSTAQQQGNFTAHVFSCNFYKIFSSLFSKHSKTSPLVKT